MQKIKHAGFEGTTLKTLVVNLASPGYAINLTVVGTSYIGTNDYYENVRAQVALCDHVLYENMAEKESKILCAHVHNALSNFYRRVANELSKKTVERVVFQGDAINYDYPPGNWALGDMTFERLNKEIGFFNARRLNSLLSELKKDEKDLSRTKDYAAKISSKQLPEWSTIDSVNREREKVIYAGIEHFVDKEFANSIGVIYEAEHLPHIVSHLEHEGYEILGEEQFDALELKNG